MSRNYESWNLSFICLVACTFYVAQLGSGFNIDTVYPLVYKDPASGRPNARESYFGYSVKFLFKQKDNVLDTAKWLLIGSPRANSTFPPHVSLKEPGQVYRCLLKSMKLNSDDNCKPLIIEKEVQNNQFYKDGKDYGWLGSAIDVHSPMNGRVVVCGYRWTNQKLIRNHYMNGVCYWSEHRLSENENFAKLVPIVDEKLQVIAGTSIYAYGQSGFSVHMALKNETEEIIIGAPGIQQWTGAVIRISDKYTNVDPIPTRRKREDTREVLTFGESLIPDVTKVRQLAPNDYFGYSVHSGIFFEDGKVLYVSGAPRASGMKGKVFIFDFLPSSLMDIKVELDGSQLGEYFGSSILAVDLTKDGKADLLVGAPQHSFQSDMYDRYGDEGKVYVYINKDGQLESQESLFGSKTRNARFGTTIASMGDVNCDGYNDVVIGAPYENDKGAVYLYLGGRLGIQPHLQTSYWQRIAAADFVSPLDGLKGFGISLAAADYDDNEYPDLAVGSFMSGHTLVFRSQPVIQLKVILRPDNTSIEPNGGSIQLNVLSSFDTPIKASPQSTITEICVAFSFYFDAEYVNIPRLSMNSNTLINNHQPFNYTAVVTRVSKSRMFKLTVTNLPYHSQDFSRPAKFRLFAKLLKNVRPLNGQCNPANEVEDQPGSQHILVTGGNTRKNTMEFCETCPVLDRMENNYFESFVSFTSDCRPDQECMEDLEVHASFPDNLKELIIGAKNILSFVVTVKNHGDPSYVTTLDIHLPNRTNLKLTNLCKLFSFSTPEEQLYSCQLSVNPLKKGSTEKMELALDLASIPSGSSGLFSINVEARMRSAEAKGRQTRFNLTVPLITAIDVEILGNSLEEQLTYIRPNSTRNDTVEEAQESIVFHHLYEVRNVLPSPVYNIDIEVLVPDNVFSSDGRTMLNIVRRPPSVEINQNGLQKAIECTAQNETVFRATELQGFLDLGQPIQKQPAEKYAKANRTALIDCFNTKGILCTKYVCSAGPLLSGTPISLSLTGSLQLMDILTFIDKKDVFVVSSAARVIIRNPVNVKQPSEHKPDVAIASTYILPQGPPTALGVAAWIIVLSVLGGILLLSLMVYGLYKMGFFKRQRYPMDGLAEETTPGDGDSEDWSAELPSNAEEVQ